MGAYQSKRNEHGDGSSSQQDKHASADLKTPLNPHAIGLQSSSPPSRDRRRWTIAGTKPEHHERHNVACAVRPVQSVRTSKAFAAPPQIRIDDLTGHSNVSRPPKPPRIRRLSELIDPAEVPIDAHIRSPSGNLLAPEQFLFHPDRPLSIRERQEEIRERVRTASRLGLVENAGDESSARKCWGGWRWCCFG